jgi:DNA-binding SARP family transcriptional activator/predicted ATPase
MPLQIFLFGAPRIERDGKSVPLKRRKTVAILAYLTVTGRPHSRDALATLLWPEYDQSGARANLRRDLSLLKRTLEDEVLVIDRSQVSIDPKSTLWLDVNGFTSKLALAKDHEHDSLERLCEGCASPLEEAVGLYAGDFMEGFSLPDSPAFDEWQFFQAEGYRQGLAEALQQLIRWQVARGNLEQAILYGRRWLALDPLHEPAQRQLMKHYGWSGQWAAAQRQYQDCLRRLDEELGVEPEEETTALYEAIKSRQLVSPAELAQPKEGLEKIATDLTLEDRIPKDISVPAFMAEVDAVDESDKQIEGLDFVGREQELDQLYEMLNQTAAGDGRVIFVIGDAGRGKTVLMQAFAKQAQARNPYLIVAGGNCNAYTGVGDPYLPFREILELLTGDVEARWAARSIDGQSARRLWRLAPDTARMLLDNGPDLLDVFLPSQPFLNRMRVAGAANSDWLERLELLIARRATGGGQNVQQSDLFEQYTRLLQTLAREQPLLLVLDDLQWADSGSINLLFHLGRRLAGSRILIAGIHRPDEVATGRDGDRHPLEKVVNEFQRQYGDVFLDLRQAEGRPFIDAYLDTEPNQLGNDFRKAFFQHTRGHALFTAEMLQGLRERGDLVQDGNGFWVEGDTLNWDILPSRIEGVIGERIGRLPAALRETLKIASVEGATFTAEVVARVQAFDERELVRQLSGKLDKQHRLVVGQGSQRLGARRLSQYRFRHILFQHYLYNSLDEVERGYLHEAVAKELEQLYGEQSADIAGELARHFEAAGLFDKAISYLQQAGDRAVRLSANDEALAHFYKVLALLETMPDTPEHQRRELSLQIALFAPLAGAKGYGAPELGKAFTRAQELCELVGEPGQLFLVLYGLWGHNFVQGDMKTARELARQCLTLAQKTQEPALLMEGHRMTDETAFFRGELTASREHLERTLSLYKPEQHRAHATVYGQDPGVASLSHGSWILWHLGYPDQALKMGREAVTLGEESDHPFSLDFALCYNAVLHQFCGDGKRVKELTEAAIHLSSEQGFVLWLAETTVLWGWVLANRGQSEQGIAQMHKGLAEYKAININLHRPYLLALLAEVYGDNGQPAEGLTLLAEALALVEKGELRHYEAELYRLKGELLLLQGESLEKIEVSFQQAIRIARQQETKSLELRAAMSLSQLWQQQGKAQEARQMLAQIYDWFTEGFDAGDLKEARALLERIA